MLQTLLSTRTRRSWSTDAHNVCSTANAAEAANGAKVALLLSVPALAFPPAYKGVICCTLRLTGMNGFSLAVKG